VLGAGVVKKKPAKVPKSARERACTTLDTSAECQSRHVTPIHDLLHPSTENMKRWKCHALKKGETQRNESRPKQTAAEPQTISKQQTEARGCCQEGRKQKHFHSSSYE